MKLPELFGLIIQLCKILTNVLNLSWKEILPTFIEIYGNFVKIDFKE